MSSPQPVASETEIDEGQSSTCLLFEVPPEILLQIIKFVQVGDLVNFMSSSKALYKFDRKSLYLHRRYKRSWTYVGLNGCQFSSFWILDELLRGRPLHAYIRSLAIGPRHDKDIEQYVDDTFVWRDGGLRDLYLANISKTLNAIGVNAPKLMHQLREKSLVAPLITIMYLLPRLSHLKLNAWCWFSGVFHDLLAELILQSHMNSTLSNAPLRKLVDIEIIHDSELEQYHVAGLFNSRYNTFDHLASFAQLRSLKTLKGIGLVDQEDRYGPKTWCAVPARSSSVESLTLVDCKIHPESFERCLMAFKSLKTFTFEAYAPNHLSRNVLENARSVALIKAMINHSFLPKLEHLILDLRSDIADRISLPGPAIVLEDFKHLKSLKIHLAWVLDPLASFSILEKRPLNETEQGLRALARLAFLPLHLRCPLFLKLLPRSIEEVELDGKIKVNPDIMDMLDPIERRKVTNAPLLRKITFNEAQRLNPERDARILKFLEKRCANIGVELVIR